ncbi:Rho termination factor [Dokdonia sp. Dokd-P16]|uniref:DUF7218 family protein n=1 Tax=Dokdonia sp. Dokd-P16 TaxID=2173169 RepID=UPI000D544075|nr:Rho termination factor [Dokdonia sp. Dokd-P16]AWH73389.1 Rho termination factor [Dokdonia sp. Dokd-P16]
MDKNDRPSVMNEEQYEALKDKGMSKEKAARIANTPDAGKKGGASKPYEERSKKELYEQAMDLEIDGCSKMDKEELIKALREDR